jgi:hypothetical protein
MNKDPLLGLGKKLKLHILLPVIYVSILVIGLLIKYTA